MWYLKRRKVSGVWCVKLGGGDFPFGCESEKGRRREKIEWFIFGRFRMR